MASRPKQTQAIAADFWMLFFANFFMRERETQSHRIWSRITDKRLRAKVNLKFKRLKIDPRT